MKTGNDNILEFTGLTRVKTQPTKVLAKAAGAKLADVIVIGTDADGDLYFASSTPDGPEVNWMLDVIKKRLLEAGGA